MFLGQHGFAEVSYETIFDIHNSYFGFFIGCSSNNKNTTTTQDVSEEETVVTKSEESVEEVTAEEEEVATTDTTPMWQEFVKTDEFGNVVNKKTKHDPRFYIEIDGYSKDSFSVKNHDVKLAIAMNDYSLLGNKTTETLKILPVYSLSGATMLNYSETGFIRILTPDGKRYDFKGNVKRDRFVFTDDEGFFSKHLRKGEDLQIVIYTSDGNDEFHFDIPSSIFSELYDEIAAKEAK